MSLLFPLWLLVGLVGLLIVLLHLRRRTRRTQEVSSLYLWRKIVHDLPPQTPKEPPPLNPLLFLQILFVVLLALALAQPIWGVMSAKGQHTVYLLDASQSMQTLDVKPSRFEAAKAQILRESQAQRGNRVSLVVVGSVPYAAIARQQDVGHIETLLSTVSGSEGWANWREALPLLQGLQVEGEALRVVIYSDVQGMQEAQSVLARAVAAEALEIRSLGRALPNVGFYRVTPEASVSRPGLWRLEGHIGNFASDSKEVTVEAWFHANDGSVRSLLRTQVRLTPNRASFFRIEVTPPGAGIVELRLPPDDLPSDNRAFFYLATTPLKPRVLYLGAVNPALQKALLTIPNLEVFTADRLPVDSDTYNLVVVDGVLLERHPRTHTLWINTSPTPGMARPGLLDDPYPSGWQSQHPLSSSLDWSGVLLNRALEIPRLAGAEVLLEASGKPLVQARTNAYGREVVVAFALQDSNWTTQTSFPVFVANLLRWVEPRLEGLTYCLVDQPCPIDPRLLAVRWQLLNPRGQPVPLPIGFTEATTQSQDSNLNRWLLRALENTFRPQQAGIWILESGGVRYPIAVNGFYPQESDLRLEQSRSAAVPETAQTSRPVWLLWGGLVAIALGVLLVEGWLAGRSEGFLNPQNLTRHNPLTRRRRAMLLLQGLAVLLLLLGLLDPRLPLPTRQHYQAVVADQPELYVGGARERLEAYLNQTSGRSRAPQGLVWLGDPPLLGSDIGHSKTPTPAPSVPGSNLQASLSLAAGLLPPGSSNRIILLADGTETSGSFTNSLAQIAARGIAVDVMPVGGIPAGEVVVEQVNFPRLIHAGDTFLLQGIVYSDRVTQARLRVWREEKLWAEQAVQLMAGRNRIETPLREAAAGNYNYRLEVLASGDTFPQNNQARALVAVQPSAKIGIFTSEDQQAEILAKALRLQGLEVRVVRPENIPKSLEEWAAFEVAILMNLPVIRLPSERQVVLERWVREQAGGLLILGGDSSFGPGGYYQTTLERLSPLSSRVPREAPKVAMLFVIDKSGSMNQPAGQARRIDIAKQAVLGALDLLHPESLAGVVAFDAIANLVVPMQSIRDKAGFAEKLDKVQPGGGTSIYPALELALQTLQKVDAAGRHMVLLTDGLSTPGDFEEVVGRIVAVGITLSTVAVGDGARLDLMENIARWGGGVAHATTDWQALPAILAQEALLQSKTPVKQEAFVPVWLDRSVGWLQGLPDVLPPLRAYVQTTAKPEALVHLLGPGGDPILASWRYGLGQVIAFTSQASGPWASEWIRSPEYPRLWAQMVHAVLPTTARLGLNPVVERKGNNIHLLVEALTPKAEPHSQLNLQAEVTLSGGLGGLSWVVPLHESALGRYETQFRVENQQGSYQVNVQAMESPIPLQNRPFTIATSIPPLPHSVQVNFAIPYLPRYGFDAQGSDVLTTLAQVSGGRVLLDPVPPEVSGNWYWTSRAVWPFLVLLSLISFMGALVLRYLPDLVLRVIQRRVVVVQ
ncbi:MAG: VWA domain-containing protein [Meiothermus sp.]|nr:VWA domain-containing protein [Meiothermus sp.]